MRTSISVWYPFSKVKFAMEPENVRHSASGAVLTM